MFASFSLICIPAFAIFSIYRQEASGISSKVLSAIQPRIYECKICGEHHCEHDFPEDDQFIAEPPTPKFILRSPPLAENGYNPLIEKNSCSEIEENETNSVVQNEERVLKGPEERKDKNLET